MPYAMIRDNGAGLLICSDISLTMPGVNDIHPALRALFREVPDGTQSGWIYDEATGEAAPAQPPEEPVNGVE